MAKTPTRRCGGRSGPGAGAAWLAAGLALALAVAAPAAAQRPPAKTLHDSPDPLLALTPGLRGAAEAPPGVAPPNPDPRNLEGVWFLQGFQYLLGPEPGVPPPLKPQYMRILEERLRMKNRGQPVADTATSCRPHGMPRLMESPYPIEIVQTPGQVTILHEVAHNIRRIYLGRPAPRALKPSYLGYSSGRWEGDTLVVQTTGLNDRIRIDDEGSSSSTRLKLTERFRKVEGGRKLEVVTTVEDPVTLERPYAYTRTFHWRPDVPIAEYICEENNRNAPDGRGITSAK